MRPEQSLSDKIRARLEKKGWITEKLFGNALQKGLPDLLCTHKNYGVRFIETKNSVAFTKAQKKKFPLLQNNGLNIYIITPENEKDLFKIIMRPGNLGAYLDLNKRRGNVLDLLSEDASDNTES